MGGSARIVVMVKMHLDLLSFKWNLIRLSGPAHGIVLKISLSYHLHVHIVHMYTYNAVFEGQSSQARQNCTQNSVRGIKT